jgi:hypothetical protein
VVLFLIGVGLGAILGFLFGRIIAPAPAPRLVPSATPIDRSGDEEPVATLLEQIAPALAAVVQPGQTTTDLARGLLEFSITLAPEVAQRWAMRVLGLPFRRELVEPVIDEAYATDLLQSSPLASRILAELRTSDGTAPLSATTFVNTVLSDDAVATLTEELAGMVTPEDIATVVDPMQKRAVEQQLEHDIPAERTRTFGSLPALFAAIDRLRATEEGQRALDALLGIVRRARSAGVPVADLFSPAH